MQVSYDHQSTHRSAIQVALLRWFAAHARDLPWRHTRDPYRIMVSEIMLQQTQVDRVIPKYHAFLEQFPTLESLAAAPTAEVIRAWAGLGYNRRAVNMQRAARAVLEQHAGRFPQAVAVLLDLPGIGPYTAGAIACFAFEQDVAFLDTNIRRVVRRLLVAADAAPSERELVGVAQSIIPPGQGWLWNQAIMELGALICTAATPACWRCPLCDMCLDYAARQQADTQALDLFLAGEPARRPLKRVAEKRETPYAGSSRFYRGRVVDVLRRVPDGLTFSSLGPLLKETYTDADDSWLRDLLAGLVRDGLVVLEQDWVRLPD
ncbi:MAG: A/G-specific adenine glycosylase [Roseiflexaceae bacterium]|nr:A/G-specific adenine glycosylase [Roseiflexaceae bacterium]